MYAFSGYCWMNQSPPNCSTNPDLTCFRGGSDNALQWSRLLLFVTIMVPFFVILISMILIYAKVRSTESRMQQYVIASFNSSTNSNTNHQLQDASDTANNNQQHQPPPQQQQRVNHRSLKRTKMVGRTALLYIGSFFICFIWAVLIAIVDKQIGRGQPNISHRNIYFPLALLAKFFMLLQGLFNVFIFFTNEISNVDSKRTKFVLLATNHGWLPYYHAMVLLSLEAGKQC